MRCRGCKDHVHLEGNNAAGAARYPRGLCRAVCKGVKEQMRLDAAGLMALECREADGNDGALGLDAVEHEGGGMGELLRRHVG